MSIRDLSTVVEQLSQSAEILEKPTKEEYEGKSVSEALDVKVLEDDAFTLFRDSIRRNILVSDLDYARKLLAAVDNTATDQQSVQSVAKATIFSERKRIRTVQDKIVVIDENLSRRNGLLTTALAYSSPSPNGSTDKDTATSTGESAGDISMEAEDSMLSMPSTPLPPNAALKNGPLVPSAAPTTLEDRLEYHRQQQESLSTALLAQTALLKRNALALGNKLESDKDVVTNAMNALDKNVDNMKRTGGRLAQYRETNAIGWRFYIVSAVVMFLSMLMALIIIKLLPKW
ncbi:uncharacterized protein V1518DRAFT_8791 [Limtongia smithiae]|uniref:uncharacterized protein n=1 Tax=Limtongia smithiae TaxID=1125753 RepID=UPI0034CD3006